MEFLLAVILLAVGAAFGHDWKDRDCCSRCKSRGRWLGRHYPKGRN